MDFDVRVSLHDQSYNSLCSYQIPWSEQVRHGCSLCQLAAVYLKITFSTSSSHPLPTSDCFHTLSYLLHKHWQSSWDLETHNKIHSLKRSVSPRRNSTHPNHSGKQCWLAFTRYTPSSPMNTMDHDVLPSYSHCHSPKTISHIFLNWPTVSTHLSSSFPFLSSSTRNPRLDNFLSNFHTFSISNVISFLIKLKIIHII